MKIRIIDLLNRIANGEEVPSKIMYQDKIYYMVGNNDYENYEYDEEPTLMYAIGNTHNINDDIEIIEEDNKIEKLLMIDGTANILLAANQTRRKINEIIDKLNKEE
jgi:hypothetical protein